MKYAKVTDNEITDTYTRKPESIGSTTFKQGITDAELEVFGIYLINVITPELNPLTHTLDTLEDPAFSDNAVTRTWSIKALSSSESEAAKKQVLRDYRTSQKATVTVSGITIDTTDPDTLAWLQAGRSYAKDGKTDGISWDIGDMNYTDLAPSQIVAIADTVFSHVQRCFTAAKTVAAAIDDYDTEAEIKAAFDSAYSSLPVGDVGDSWALTVSSEDGAVVTTPIDGVE